MSGRYKSYTFAPKNQALQKGFRPLVAGLFFSLLWSSAATATKIGLQAVQPFTICVVRFFLAGTIMIVISLAPVDPSG